MLERSVKFSKSHHRSEKSVEKEKKRDKKESVVCKVNTLLCSTDPYPLLKWKKFIKNGYVKRLPDIEIDGRVIDIFGAPNQVWIASPKELDQKIGCSFNWLFFIIKSVPDRQLIIDVQVSDSANVKRTFKFDTKTNITKLRHSIALLDLNLKPGTWNCLEMDLPSLVGKSYGTRYTELCRLQIHGTCKIRRVYMTSMYVSLEDMPPQYRIHPTPTINDISNQADNTPSLT